VIGGAHIKKVTAILGLFTAGILAAHTVDRNFYTSMPVPTDHSIWLQ
jgi:hypothetical protein